MGQEGWGEVGWDSKGERAGARDSGWGEVGWDRKGERGGAGDSGWGGLGPRHPNHTSCVTSQGRIQDFPEELKMSTCEKNE